MWLVPLVPVIDVVSELLLGETIGNLSIVRAPRRSATSLLLMRVVHGENSA